MDIGEFGGYWCMELCCAMAKLDTIRWWVRATVQSGCGEFGCGVLQYNFDGGWWCHNIFDIKRRFDPSSVASKFCRVPVESAPEHPKCPPKCSGAPQNGPKSVPEQAKTGCFAPEQACVPKCVPEQQMPELRIAGT